MAIVRCPCCDHVFDAAKKGPALVEHWNLFRAVWNGFAERHALPKLARTSRKVQDSLGARIREIGIDAFWGQLSMALEWIGSDLWHLGKNNRGWKADPGYLLRPDQITQLAARLEASRRLPNTGGNGAHTGSNAAGTPSPGSTRSIIVRDDD